MRTPRDADLLRETEEVHHLIVFMADTHPTGAHRLAIDFQDSRHEYLAHRLSSQDYAAELSEIRHRLDAHFIAVSNGGGTPGATERTICPVAAAVAERRPPRPALPTDEEAKSSHLTGGVRFPPTLRSRS